MNTMTGTTWHREGDFGNLIQTRTIHRSGNVYQIHLNHLQNTIEILNRDLLRRKEKKFQRDTIAFTSGRAYKWKKFKKEDRRSNLDPIRLDREDPTVTLDEGNQTEHLPLPSIVPSGPIADETDQSDNLPLLSDSPFKTFRKTLHCSPPT